MLANNVNATEVDRRDTEEDLDFRRDSHIEYGDQEKLKPRQ